MEIAREKPIFRTWGTWLAFLVLLIVCTCVYGYWVIHARPMFDESTNVRRAFVPPWHNATYEERFYAIDHPAFSRYVWQGAFAITGWHWPQFDDQHYQFQPQMPLFPGNIRLLDGELAPRGPVNILRAVSAVFMAATCAVVFFLTVWLLRSALAGLVMAVPFLVHPGVGQWMIGYPGTDAMLLFWLVTFLALWVVFHVKGTARDLKQVLLLAVVAGLAAGTKINAGLLVVAFALYSIAFGKSPRKWLLTLGFCVAAFGVFVAINPVFWQPGASGLIKGMKDVFARRAAVMEEQTKYLNPTPTLAYFKERLVFTPLVPLAAIAFYRVRNEAWLVPAAIWAAIVGVGSYLTLNRYDIRLGMPIDVAVIVVTLMAALAVTVEQVRRIRQRMAAVRR